MSDQEEPSVDLNPAIVNIYGPGTSGKSNFIKYLLSSPRYSRHLVFDPMQEYDPDEYNVYRPDEVEYEGGNAELNMVVKDALSWPRAIRPRYLVVDEAANFLPAGNKPIGGQMSKLAYHNTHEYPGITVITSNRHPGDLNRTIREMYDWMLVFGYRGDNARRKLNGLAEGLADASEQTGEYEAILVGPQGEMWLVSPVRDMGEYERL